MKGFFKRDAMLMGRSLKFQLVLMALLAVLVFLKPDSASTMLSILNIYAFAFVATGLVGQVQADEVNGWMAFAATVPNGRWNQVTARYLLTAVCCLVIALLAGGMGLLTEGLDSLLSTLAFLGAWLLYLALALPLGYRFGSKSRMIVLLVLALCGAVIGGMGAMGGGSSNLIEGVTWFWPVSLGLVLIGLVALAVSYVISLRIMAHKEL